MAAAPHQHAEYCAPTPQQQSQPAVAPGMALPVSNGVPTPAPAPAPAPTPALATTTPDRSFTPSMMLTPTSAALPPQPQQPQPPTPQPVEGRRLEAFEGAGVRANNSHLQLATAPAVALEGEDAVPSEAVLALQGRLEAMHAAGVRRVYENPYRVYVYLDSRRFWGLILKPFKIRVEVMSNAVVGPDRAWPCMAGALGRGALLARGLRRGVVRPARGGAARGRHGRDGDCWHRHSPTW